MNVNFNNRDAVYLQIVRYFKEKIAIGKFEPGEEIPSRRELASRMKLILIPRNERIRKWRNKGWFVRRRIIQVKLPQIRKY